MFFHMWPVLSECRGGRVVSHASRSTSGLGEKERLVTFARYSWALPKCWQSQSDCTAANYDVTSYGLPYQSRSIDYNSLASVSYVAAMETKRVLSKVASQMGYSSLRPKQEEVILDFVRGSDVFVSLPHRKREVAVLQLATRGVRRDTPLAGRIHCNRGQP